MSRLQDVIQRGTRASQPLATAVAVGTLYGVTDEGDIVERSNGSIWQAYSPSSSQTGTVVQVVNTQTGAEAHGTTTIPADDTIPQKTEGTEFMTLAVTPTDAANKLKIDVVIMSSYTVTAWTIVALFQDAGNDALAAIADFQAADGGGANSTIIAFSHYMTAGTTSSTTFKVRAGGHTAGTITFNGAGSARLLGGVMASSITITEIVP